MKEIRHEDVKSRWTSLSADDWNEIDVQAQILGAIFEARKDRSLTQKELGELSGVAQTFIARLENFRTDPQLSTILKILRPLGKTLAVVPIADQIAADKQTSEGDALDVSDAVGGVVYDIKEMPEDITTSVSRIMPAEDLVVA